MAEHSPDWTGDDFPEEFFDMTLPQYSILWVSDDLKKFALWRRDGEFSAPELINVAKNASIQYSDFSLKLVATAMSIGISRKELEPYAFLRNFDPYFSLGHYIVRNLSIDVRNAIAIAAWTSEHLLDKSGEVELDEKEKYLLKASQKIVAEEHHHQSTVRRAISLARKMSL